MRRLRPMSIPLATALAIAACGGRIAAENHEDVPAPASDAGSSTTPTPTSVPSDGNVASLPSLVLWLQASKGVELDGPNGSLVTWRDQSPEHNDATQDVGTGIHVGTPVNGYATLAFDGRSSLTLPSDAALDEWSGDFLVEMVLRADRSVAQSQGVLSCWGRVSDPLGVSKRELVQATFLVGPDKTFARFAQTCIVQSERLSNGDDAVFEGSEHVLGFWRHDRTLELRLDGKTASSDDLQVLATPRCSRTIVGAVDLNGQGNASSFFASELAELVVAKSALAQQTVDAVEGALVAKYGLH